MHLFGICGDFIPVSFQVNVGDEFRMLPLIELCLSTSQLPGHPALMDLRIFAYSRISLLRASYVVPKGMFSTYNCGNLSGKYFGMCHAVVTSKITAMQSQSKYQ